MNRTRTWVSLSLLLAGLFACGGGEPARPDVVLIVIDTLRADRLGCYGYPRPTSPVMDALATEGALFEDVTAQASWTLVSMSSLWTGRYVTANLEAPDPDWPVLAETFQRAGYHTIGGSANPLLDAASGFGRGFDVYGSYGARGEGGGFHDAEKLFRVLLQQLDEVRAGEDAGDRAPVFLYAQPFDPHTPYRRHREFEEELPRRGVRGLLPPGWHAEQLDAFGPPAPEDDPDWQKALATMMSQRRIYEQEVRYVDRAIGSFLDELRARGLLEHAVVAIVSDHGEGLWDHRTPLEGQEARELPPELFFFGGHGYTLYQEGIYTPFLLWGSGVPAGLRVAAPVENVDLFPTLLELADLAPPGRLDGRTLSPLLASETPAPRRYLYSFVRQYASVQDRETGYKLISPTEYGLKNGLELELYHLPSDPIERHDLAGERPEEVTRLLEVLVDWIAAHPTRTTDGRQRTPEQLEMMRALGYTGEHTSSLPPEHEDERDGE